MPELAQLPKNGHHGIKKPLFLKKIEKRIQEHHFNIFEKKAPLHKLLSKMKVWILKTEMVIDKLLHGIRKNAQELESKKNGKK